MKKICVDFDGTIIHNYVYPGFSEPKEGVREALQALKDMGFFISIYSCRNSLDLIDDKKKPALAMANFLRENNIPFDEICEFDKPIATYYIDDRGIKFDNNWEEIVIGIKEKENSKEN